MGLIDFFRMLAGPGEGATQKALPRIRNTSVLDVVGESFYGSSFKKISKSLFLKRGQDSNVIVTIKADPYNRFSSSGKAVAVFVSGHQVGHVPESLAPQFFDKLQQRGGAATADGRIWIDNLSADFTRCSVQIFTGVPPQFEDEEPPLGYQTSSSYYLKYSPATQKQIDELFAIRLAEGVRECPRPENLTSAFLSFRDFDDRELIKSVMAAHNIESMDLKSRGPSAQIMLIGDGELGSSVHTPRALLNSIPILTTTEFFANYRGMAPNSVVLDARSRFRPWRDSRLGPYGQLTLDNQQILYESQDGVFSVPGNCFRGSPSFKVGIFEEDASWSEHLKAARAKLWTEEGLEQFDSAVFTCNVGPEDINNTFGLQFRGVTLAYTRPENYDYFSHVKKSDQVLLQLDNFGGTDFTSSFELAKWLIEQ